MSEYYRTLDTRWHCWDFRWRSFKGTRKSWNEHDLDKVQSKCVNRARFHKFTRSARKEQDVNPFARKRLFNLTTCASFGPTACRKGVNVNTTQILWNAQGRRVSTCSSVCWAMRMCVGKSSDIKMCCDTANKFFFFRTADEQSKNSKSQKTSPTVHLLGQQGPVHARYRERGEFRTRRRRCESDALAVLSQANRTLTLAQQAVKDARGDKTTSYQDINSGVST